MNIMKSMFRKCCSCNHHGKPESTEGAACAIPGYSLMKAWTLENSRKLCARAIRRTSAAAPTGIAHMMLIQRRPMRMRGTMPSCGGSQWLKTIRSSAALRVDAMGSCGGGLIFTESVIGFGLPPSPDRARTRILTRRNIWFQNLVQRSLSGTWPPGADAGRPGMRTGAPAYG